MDKKACAAIHAVNLRNFLGAQCRTVREEQGDESPEFIAMIDGDLVYLEGCRTASGFFTVDEMELPPRLYRIHAAGPSIHLEPVAVHADELDPRHVFLLDGGKKMFIWTGLKSKNTIRFLMQSERAKNEPTKMFHLFPSGLKHAYSRRRSTKRNVKEQLRLLSAPKAKRLRIGGK